MSRKSAISVIVPCYNHGKFLDETLRSVAAQTHRDWECLVIDDGSTDNTRSVALKWCETDNRFRYFFKENGGLSSARNKGVDEAKGNYIQFLDADDILDPDKFALSLRQSAGAGVIITGFTLMDENARGHTQPSFTLKSELFNFYSILTGWDDDFVIPIHCGLFKANLFSTMRFNESLRAKEDWLMWLELYQQKFETVYIDQPLAVYRMVPQGMSQDRPLMHQNLVQAYRLIYPILPVEHREVFFTKVMDTLSRVLFETEELLYKTRQSKSYRIGNFFARNYNRLKKQP